MRKFLDVTKANLVFAKAIVIVEGDAENILLPILAKILRRNFSEYGVSIVNVGSRGLFRYSKRFQRNDEKAIPVKIACVADRDIIPDTAKEYVREGSVFESATDCAQIITRLKEHDAGPVKTFISPKWTLEYDLAYSGLGKEVHVAVQLAKKCNNKTFDRDATEKEAISTFNGWLAQGLQNEELAAKFFKPLYKENLFQKLSLNVHPATGLFPFHEFTPRGSLVIDLIEYRAIFFKHKKGIVPDVQYKKSIPEKELTSLKRYIVEQIKKLVGPVRYFV